MFSGIFLFIGIIVFLMVLMSSVNTLLMAMMERTREIGTMLAMGTPRDVGRRPLHGRGHSLGASVRPSASQAATCSVPCSTLRTPHSATAGIHRADIRSAFFTYLL